MPILKEGMLEVSDAPPIQILVGFHQFQFHMSNLVCCNEDSKEEATIMSQDQPSWHVASNVRSHVESRVSKRPRRC